MAARGIVPPPQAAGITSEAIKKSLPHEQALAPTKRGPNWQMFMPLVHVHPSYRHYLDALFMPPLFFSLFPSFPGIFANAAIDPFWVGWTAASKPDQQNLLGLCIWWYEIVLLPNALLPPFAPTFPHGVFSFSCLYVVFDNVKVLVMLLISCSQIAACNYNPPV
jgi:hypothetical protein